MTSTAIKILATILMIIDHIGQFFKGTPLILRQIGRISAPLFIFTACAGFYHTKDKLKYIKKIYSFSFIMSIISFILNLIIINPPKSFITNNIFSTILLIDIIVYIFETSKNNENKRNLFMFYFLIYNIISVIISNSLLLNRGNAFLSLMGIIPNVFYSEGGLLIVLYGVFTYFVQTDRAKLIILNISISLFIIFSSEISTNNLLNVNFQWMMLAALPFMLIYNGKKGKGYKQFFYIFYPFHIALLSIFAYILTK